MNMDGHSEVSLLYVNCLQIFPFISSTNSHFTTDGTQVTE